MIVAAARKKGVPVEYMVKDNEGHSLARKENQIEFYARARPASSRSTSRCRPNRPPRSRSLPRAPENRRRVESESMAISGG